jgi:hypothetical protein
LVETPVVYVLHYTWRLSDHTKVNFNFLLVWPSDEFEQPSQFHGHSPWPQCEVALILV